MEQSISTHVTFTVVIRKKERIFKCIAGKVASLRTHRPLRYTGSFQFHPSDVFDDGGAPPFQFLVIKRDSKTLHVCLFTSQQHNNYGTYHLYGNHPFLTIDEVLVFKQITGSDEETIRNTHPETFPNPENLFCFDSTFLMPDLFQEGDEISLYW
jgi:hypothetical protein